MFKNYIIVVGGGHAGLEAVNIISKMGENVILITNNIKNIGELSCNPSMGGLGKSQLIREIDAMGGVMGYLSTKSSLQLKKIKISKGEAINCVRSQICRRKYKYYAKRVLKNKKIKVIQDKVIKILIKNDTVVGVKTKNLYYRSKTVILTVGTFLKSKICIGLKKYKEGRINEKNSKDLSEQLNLIIEKSKVFKTGTPPRISKKNIDFNNFKIQKGDYNPIPTLSYKYKKKEIKNKKNCWITKTTKKTKLIIKKNLFKSPIYNDLIIGTSPRYCPSIEDKYYKFYKKQYHNIFLEPENKNAIYPNGVSTSISYKKQIKLIKSIKGLEKSEIIEPGYAIEYNFFPPKNLKKSLESKIIKGLFFAGQINGTTGYEEAGGQGIVAGINSCLFLKNKKYWYPNKNNTYIGFMINDIIKNNITEPYRVFASKNKFRLKLRENNARERLLKVFKNLIKNKEKTKNAILIKFNIKKIFLNNLIIKKINKQLKIYFKYKNYLKKKLINNFVKKKILLKNFKIFKNINYFNIKGLLKENAEKLNKKKPINIFELLKKNLEIGQINLIIKHLNKIKKI